MSVFLIDENLPRALVAMAREHDKQARWVREVMPGATDRQILDRLSQSEEILVTRDIRFANLILALMAHQSFLSGAVLIREQRMKTIRQAWQRYLDQGADYEHALIVLEAHRTRMRRPS